MARRNKAQEHKRKVNHRKLVAKSVAYREDSLRKAHTRNLQGVRGGRHWEPQP